MEDVCMNTKSKSPDKPVEMYFEKKIGGTLYRVTNIHDGKVDLTKALEDLIVRKIIQQETEHITN